MILPKRESDFCSEHHIEISRKHLIGKLTICYQLDVILVKAQQKVAVSCYILKILFASYVSFFWKNSTFKYDFINLAIQTVSL